MTEVQLPEEVIAEASKHKDQTTENNQDIVTSEAISQSQETEEKVGYDLESFKPELGKVNARQTEEFRWEFDVPNRQTGRWLAVEFCKAYGVEKRTLEDLREEETISNDVRLSGQVAYSEYNEDFDTEGEEEDIVLVELYTRALKSEMTTEQMERFNNAIKAVIEKLNPDNVTVR